MNETVEARLTWEFSEQDADLGRHLVAELLDLNTRIKHLATQRAQCLKWLDEHGTGTIQFGQSTQVNGV